MISLKKYLDAVEDEPPETIEGGTNTLPTGAAKRLEVLIAPNARELLTVAIAAYRSALLETGKYSMEACPALGEGLKVELQTLSDRMAANLTCEMVEGAERTVRQQLEEWGEHTATHYLEKTGEVKELLLVLARTAESVGARDQRYAQQLNEVTARLDQIARLDDLTLIRASIVKSASELKCSIDRMAAEGKTAIDRLRVEVSHYQAKLDEAEEVASSDSLTGLRSRLFVERQIERRIEAEAKFCVAIADIDGFKLVNDRYGHLIGDELLKQFAGELRSASRSTDVIGRLGGDEFILLLDCTLAEAHAQVDRLQAWVCGNYTVSGNGGPVLLRVDASFGLAERQREERMTELIARADTEMYRNKAEFRAREAGSRQ